MSDVVLEHVRKVFPAGVVAVDDVTLAAGKGELMVLVGPSGCGKTTTLRLIAGLDRPTSGTIRIGGRDMDGVPPGRRDVAMVFQDAPLYPHMSVRRNLAFPLRALGLRRAEIDRRVDETAGLLGIRDVLDRRPAALSGGQRQRVALGRSIVRRPGIWLLDEPLSNLDPTLRAQLRIEIKSLQRALGITTIYVTHDQEEAMAIADRLVVLKDGAVQQSGPPMLLYQRPANRFVAGFLGSPGMNFLRVRIRINSAGAYFEHDADAALTLADGSIDAESAAGLGEALLGVRPEHLTPSTPDNQGRSLACRVEQIEPLGDRTNIVVETSGGVRLIWRASSDAAVTLSIGQMCRLTADPAHVHLFESGEPGRALRVDSSDT